MLNNLLTERKIDVNAEIIINLNKFIFNINSTS